MARICEYYDCKDPAEFLLRPCERLFQGRGLVSLCKEHRNRMVGNKGDGHLKAIPMTIQDLAEYADCKGLSNDDSRLLNAVMDKSYDDWPVPAWHNRRGGGRCRNKIKLCITMLVEEMGLRDAKNVIDETLHQKYGKEHIELHDWLKRSG